MQRYSKKVHLTEEAGRLGRLLESKPEPTLELAPVRFHRVEWRLGADQFEHLVADYEAGMTGTFLQVKYKLSKGSVLRVLHEAGTEVRRQPVGEAQVSAIIELYKSGLSIRQTAVTAGIPKTTVLNILARSGVAMRPAIRVPRSQ
jgi:hypothetical protein